MSSPTFMLVAGEVSGDINAAELVQALRRDAIARSSPFPPRFFGAGGPRMATAGVDLAFDLTRHAVIGPWEVFKNYSKLKRTFDHLLKMAVQRQPEVIILVDFSGFNLRFAAAVRKHIRHRQSAFTNWNPRIVYYVSPQVWASRPDRVIDLARDVDLVLSIFPFEKEWYARRVPQLPVEFVGHPMVDRYGKEEGRRKKEEGNTTTPLVLLLPGSRVKELSKHLPVMLEAARTMRTQQAVRVRVILPNPAMEQMTRQALPKDSDIEIRMGDLAVSLAEADVVIAKSGTVTLECAFFGVPTVVMYITNPLVYAFARRVVKVDYLAMPNLLAGKAVFPEFIQDAATPANLAREALELLNDLARRQAVQAEVRQIVASLGPPGAAQRAAAAIGDFVNSA